MPRVISWTVFGAGLLVSISRASPPPTVSYPVDGPNGRGQIVVSLTPDREEGMVFAQLLEQAHYGRQRVGTDYSAAIPDLMRTLDPEHAIFLGKDAVSFDGSSVRFNLRFYGSVTIGTWVYNLFEQRWRERHDWITRHVAGNLGASGTYNPLTSPYALWPSSQKAADEYWESRLRAEWNVEMLTAKSESDARTTIQARYDAIYRNVLADDASERRELYLTTIARLYDPHSAYFSPETLAAAAEAGQQFKGIGAMIEVQGLTCRITELVRGGPAERSGAVHEGDEIVAVATDDGPAQEIRGLSAHNVTHLLRGREGSKVTISIVPFVAEQPGVRRAVTLVRSAAAGDRVRARAATYDIPKPSAQPSTIGVISVRSLYGVIRRTPNAITVSNDVAVFLRKLADTKASGVVLDLRHNAGGYLSEAVAIVNLFVGAKPVVRVKKYDGQIVEERTSGAPPAYDGPLVVLVDSDTSSGAEIIAGALQAYGRAVVVGATATHGSATVQQVIDVRQVAPRLAANGAKTGGAKITIEQFFLPDGRSTQLNGVASDIVIPVFQDPWKPTEAELPHALPADRLAATGITAKAIDPAIITHLRQRSVARQTDLPEFAWYRKRNDFLTPKPWPLDAAQWSEFVQKHAATWRSLCEAELALAPSSYPHHDMAIEGVPSAEAKEVGGAAAIYPDEYDSYDRFDVPLREALRIASDMRR